MTSSYKMLPPASRLLLLPCLPTSLLYIATSETEHWIRIDLLTIMSIESCLQLTVQAIAWKSALEDANSHTIARVLDLFRIPVGSRRKNTWGDSRKVNIIILQLSFITAFALSASSGTDD